MTKEQILQSVASSTAVDSDKTTEQVKHTLNLAEWSLIDLRNELVYQKAPGEHTMAMCGCGRNPARGGGVCPQCIVEEINRRGIPLQLGESDG